MESIEITLPKLGESIVSATVVQWLKKEGDVIYLDEPLVEVSTDKVNSEIPSPVAGRLIKILAQIDQEIEVGAPLAQIQIEQMDQTVAVQVKKPQIETKAAACSQANAQFFSPAVMRLAQENDLSMEQISHLQGTGEGGRVSKKDIQKYLQLKLGASHHPTTDNVIQQKVDSIAQTSTQEPVERLKMTSIRKAIAENMVRSFYEAPHASLVTEIDVTVIMKYIAQEKEQFYQKNGFKLTITSFLVHALAQSIEKFPMLNSSLDKDTIMMKRFINVGIAVNIEKGLVVPVIKNCHTKNVANIAKDLSSLSNKARENKLLPDDVTEGSITLTNFGMTGTLIGVPIIRYPEVAIIGAGAVQKRVVVSSDDSFAVRSMMYLTLTFDHRVIDGIYGCEFLALLKENLEQYTSIEV